MILKEKTDAYATSVMADILVKGTIECLQLATIKDMHKSSIRLDQKNQLNNINTTE
ncbi:hypothetical protein [Marivirga sp.]|uniref:hypothetical protein n=1 Tax=Marivirga sp. TaxID=2018662 RepID=UPI002D7E707B|nr:hypothetical protein [Marivirga sp.]HET8860046.1 hypothetical protein [Marivirga sp.]